MLGTYQIQSGVFINFQFGICWWNDVGRRTAERTEKKNYENRKMALVAWVRFLCSCWRYRGQTSKQARRSAKKKCWKIWKIVADRRANTLRHRPTSTHTHTHLTPRAGKLIQCHKLDLKYWKASPAMGTIKMCAKFTSVVWHFCSFIRTENREAAKMVG